MILCADLDGSLSKCFDVQEFEARELEGIRQAEDAVREWLANGRRTLA